MMQDYISQSTDVLKNKNTVYKNISEFRAVLNNASAHLFKNDVRLRKIIPSIGICRLKPHKKYFETLVDAIVSQQLSVTVAEAIFKRFKFLFNGKPGYKLKFPTPFEIISMKDEKLRACGLSNAKVKYVKDLAVHIHEKKINIKILNKLTDNEIIGELVQVKGIGIWTAHMFLIFCLGRLNILPVGDLGLKKSIMINYNLRKLPDSIKIERISKLNNWSPYNSVATWYLWQSLNV